MSSHKHDEHGALVFPNPNVIEYQDLYRESPTADRAYEKYVARGRKHGHDVEDWLASEREIEAERRDNE